MVDSGIGKLRIKKLKEALSPRLLSRQEVVEGNAWEILMWDCNLWSQEAGESKANLYCFCRETSA
jgi:hypothetical protein